MPKELVEKGLTKTGKPRQRRAGAGRPVGTGYHATRAQRQLVRTMAAMGLPQEQMVDSIINPKTGAPISLMTLGKHFRHELDKGMIEANTQVLNSMFVNATTPTPTYPGGIPSLQIFWAKCRMRWQQRPELHPVAPTPEQIRHDPHELAKRLAFALRRGERPTKKALAES